MKQPPFLPLMHTVGKLHLPHEGHERHLCIIWHAQRDVEPMRALVQNAKFICVLCGRVAAKKEHLCQPTPIQLRNLGQSLDPDR